MNTAARVEFSASWNLGSRTTPAQRLRPSVAASFEPHLPGSALRAPAWGGALVARSFGAALARAPDYRWEGLVAGAAAVGVLGGVLAHGFCSDPDAGGGSRNCLGSTAWGAVVGGVTGGLIGGLIPKPPREDRDAGDGGTRNGVGPVR
ncbi:MAG TPA: hypothetical protein VNI61_08415 [Gemmatimonadales bacterium]|nr:hypothetical protein [Gemmatimonadales bacterium]